jgi:hypothetical protein
VLRVEAVWKLGEILQTIEQSKIFRDFFDSTHFKTSQKRTKQARVKTRGRFHTGSVETVGCRMKSDRLKRAESTRTRVASGTTGVCAKAAIPLLARVFQWWRERKTYVSRSSATASSTSLAVRGKAGAGPTNGITWLRREC